MGILTDIIAERQRQDKKWMEQNHSDEWWLPIMVEELGEVGKAMLENNFNYPGAKLDDIRKELIEMLAVGMAWVECMDRREEE